MRIYLLGAEQPTNSRLAKDAGAKNVGFSFHSLYPRLPKSKLWLISERLTADSVYVASGGYAFSKKATPSQVSEFIDRFENFLSDNAEHISLVSEYDGPLSIAERNLHRQRLGLLFGEKFVPVWDPETGRTGLDSLAERYGTVGVTSQPIREDPTLAARMNPLRNKYGTKFHALDGARPDDLMTGRFASAATTGWLSPMKYGETIVWDGARMVRYNTKMKDQARRRHRSTFRLAGFDAEAILNDDHEEISRFTVWSYARLEDAVSKRQGASSPEFSELSTSPTWKETAEQVETPLPDADNSVVIVRNEPNLPTPRASRSRMPVMDFETVSSTEYDADGNQIQVDRLLTKKSTVPLMQCDTCHIAGNCPAFSAGSECAYDLPIEIKTKDQLLALLQTMIEMQGQRVAFMRFQEQLGGGYSDPNLSLEMDRLFKMVEQLKNITDTSETIKMSIEARAGGGVLSRLFGEKAASVATALPAPMESANVIQGILEG